MTDLPLADPGGLRGEEPNFLFGPQQSIESGSHYNIDAGSLGFQAQFPFERLSVSARLRAMVKIIEPKLELGICFGEFVKNYLAGLNPAVGAQVEPAGHWIQTY
jgi:hypothetical protein